MRKRRPRLQVCQKRLYRCLFCGEGRYDALQVHRVVSGKDGGVYAEGNVVVLCASHHALLTAGRLTIHRLCRSSYAAWVAHCTDEQGNDVFLPLVPNPAGGASS